MRFFELQDRARRESLRLVVLFAVAVTLTVLGVHFALWGGIWLLERLLPIGGWAPRGFGAVNIGVTLLLVLGGWWIEASNLAARDGAERLARRLGAREARPGASAAEQRLVNILQEVCIAANMPCPQPMVVPRASAINAFAAGHTPEDGVVAVTEGALDLLTRDELQGLVAHECSHLREGDTRLNMQLAGMVFGLELVWRFGQTVRERGGVLTVVGSIVMAVGVFGWWAGRALQAAVARQREYLADARAVQWTRSRDGLGGVLRKALAQQQAGAADRRPWLPSAQHLLLLGDATPRQRWLDPHPPLRERIQRVYGRPMAALPLPADGAPAVLDL